MSSSVFSPSMFSVLRAGAMVNLSIWSSSWFTKTHLKFKQIITQDRFLPNLNPSCFQSTSMSVRLWRPSRWSWWPGQLRIFGFVGKLDKDPYCKWGNLCKLGSLPKLDRCWKFIVWCFLALLRCSNRRFYVLDSWWFAFGTLMELRGWCCRKGMIIRQGRRFWRSPEFLTNNRPYNDY